MLPRVPLLLLLLLATARAQPPPIILTDVSRAVGLDYSFGPKKSYGGPSIADLDDDGYPDLLFTHHDKHPIEIYFNQRNGKFAKVPPSKFHFWVDAHAINAFRYGPESRDVHFAVSRGGAFGRRPAPVHIFHVSRDRKITEVTQATGTSSHNGRGRTALFFNLRGPRAENPALVDMLSINAAGLNRRLAINVAFGNEYARPKFRQTAARGFSRNSDWFGALVDFDNDGRIDLVSFEELRFYKVSALFRFTEVTARVLPPGLRPVGVVSVVELDFDNDGLWDLYVATTRTGDLRWRRPIRQYKDYLLRNVGGRYVDVTAGAGIPQDGQTRGVTAADLDNDGRIDLVVSKFLGRSVVLRNVGGGKFEASRGVMPPRLQRWVPADGLQAVDYDLDGRVDVVLSEGDGVKASLGGYYRVLRNLSPRAGMHYLLVRVGYSPNRLATSQHAVVRVRVGATWMRRRVGANGVSVSVSMIETLHFGLGAATVADRVVVTWMDGSSRWVKDVAVDQVLSVGLLR